MDWNRIQNTIFNWSEITFPDSGVKSKLAHLREEIDEIDDDPTNLEEWADGAILFINAAKSAGYSMTQIYDAVELKHEKNTQRKWGLPDENGVVHHVSEGNEANG